MTPPLVSAVIPVYNRAAFVLEAVESVLAQSYPAVECIVVDDASQDGTPDRVEERFASRGVRVVRLEENRGVSAARNAGVRVCGGEFLAFCDSDDLWKSRKIERQVAYLAAHPELGLCHTDEIWLRDGRHLNPRPRHRKEAGDLFARSLELCLISPSSVLMRRNFFETLGGFDESMRLCEDYDLWLRVTARHEVGYVPEKLTVKRGGHADQLSKNPCLDKYRIESVARLIVSGVLDGPRRELALGALRAKASVYAGGCLKRGRAGEADYYSGLAENLAQGGGWADVRSPKCYGI